MGLWRMHIVIQHVNLMLQEFLFPYLMKPYKLCKVCNDLTNNFVKLVSIASLYFLYSKNFRFEDYYNILIDLNSYWIPIKKRLNLKKPVILMLMILQILSLAILQDLPFMYINIFTTGRKDVRSNNN